MNRRFLEIIVGALLFIIGTTSFFYIQTKYTITFNNLVILVVVAVLLFLVSLFTINKDLSNHQKKIMIFSIVISAVVILGGFLLLNKNI